MKAPFVLAIAAIVAACGGGEGEAGTGENTAAAADTASVPAQDPLAQPVVPTQDTAVMQTAPMDTTQGQAPGAAGRTTDSAASGH